MWLGNTGCFEVIESYYGGKRAYELLECCRCGELKRVVLE